MRNLINFIKADFASVYFAWNQVFGKVIPKWMIILYYVIVGIICLPALPFVLMWRQYQMWQLDKWFKEVDEELAKEFEDK